MDLFPTILDVLDVEDRQKLMKGIIGTSLRPLIENGRALDRIIRVDTRLQLASGRITAFRSDRFKYVYYHDSCSEELFDMVADPEEMRSVLDEPQMEAVAQEYRERGTRMRIIAQPEYEGVEIDGEQPADHAGKWETSMFWHLYPDLTHMDKFRPCALELPQYEDPPHYDYEEKARWEKVKEEMNEKLEPQETVGIPEELPQLKEVVPPQETPPAAMQPQVVIPQPQQPTAPLPPRTDPAWKMPEMIFQRWVNTKPYQLQNIVNEYTGRPRMQQMLSQLLQEHQAKTRTPPVASKTLDNLVKLANKYEDEGKHKEAEVIDRMIKSIVERSK